MGRGRLLERGPYLNLPVRERALNRKGPLLETLRHSTAICSVESNTGWLVGLGHCWSNIKLTLVWEFKLTNKKLTFKCTISWSPNRSDFAFDKIYDHGGCIWMDITDVLSHRFCIALLRTLILWPSQISRQQHQIRTVPKYKEDFQLVYMLQILFRRTKILVLFCKIVNDFNLLSLQYGYMSEFRT
jgi:hypothetical protein